MTKILIYAQFAVLGVIFLLVPNMTRQGLLFAVPVPADFRDTQEGRRAVRMFRLAVAIGIALGLLGIAILPMVEGSFVPTIALCVVTWVAYYKANRFVAPFAVKSDGTRSIELSETPERLPRFVWLALGRLCCCWPRRYIWISIGPRFPCASRFISVRTEHRTVGWREVSKVSMGRSLSALSYACGSCSARSQAGLEHAGRTCVSACWEL